MRLSKKLLSGLLAMLMCLSSVPAFALPTDSDTNDAEVFVTDIAAFWGKTEGETIYIIAAYPDQSLLCSIGKLGSDSVDELRLNNVPLLAEPNYSSTAFWENVLSYCKSQLRSSDVNTATFSHSSIQPRNTYGDLQNAMYSIYGRPYTNKLLKTDYSYPVAIEVREMLTIDITYNNDYNYSKGQAVTSFASACMSNIPGLSKLSHARVVSFILDASGAIFEAFSESGSFHFYNCTAIRHRYTNIAGNGAYSNAIKADYLIGADNINASTTAKLAGVIDVVYTPNQSYYQESGYTSLIRDGYYAYTH
ncbi:hypothetical protein DW741_01000 [Ruminococcaceae bacterium AM28-23LB]|nr:hypothetical protein DW741_01000 [Ruminococcaceae bacterium AM28-23LB]